MIIRHVTEKQMEQSLKTINTGHRYADNVKFKTLNPRPKGFDFTLSVHKAADPGGRRSSSGRKIAAACWHAHCDFMRAIYKLAPQAVIISAFTRYEDAADFEETHEETGHRNIGGPYEPLAYRNACTCRDNTEGRARAHAAALADADRRLLLV